MLVQDEIIKIIAEQVLLEPSDLTSDMTLADLGLDSMGIVEIIFSFEEAFDISIPFNANDPNGSEFDISTVGTVLLAIEKLIAKKLITA